MKDLLLYFLEHMTLEPKKVSVEEKDIEGQVEFHITCAQEDIGRIIGKKGKIIKALRRVLSILALREGKRVNIVMVDQTLPQEAAESA